MNPIIWFEIYVQDMARARKFYEAVLGYTLQPLVSPMPGAELMSFPMEQNSVGAGGALVKMAGVSPGGCGTIVYFHSKDCAVEQARIEAAGGRIQRPKTAIGEHGNIVLAYDTEGNMFGVHSM